MKELKDIVLKKGDVIYYNDGQICLVNPTEIQLDTKTCNTIIKVLRPVEYQIIYKSPTQILDKEEKELEGERMKAYVIKNKELYKTANSRVWTKDIRKCAKWDTFEKAEQYLKDSYLSMLNCEVVEITIAEGDLEKQIRADERRKVCEEIRNFMTQDSCLTKEELIECLESFTAKSIFQLLDQIEGESK